MTCENAKALFIDSLGSESNDPIIRSLEEHLKTCENCALELNQMRQTWDELARLPVTEPGEQMRLRFYSMLNRAQNQKFARNRTVSFQEKLFAWFNGLPLVQPAFQLAVILICLITGFLLGRTGSFSNQSNHEIMQLKQEVGEMRQLVTLSMLEQSSSSSRIQAISFCQNIQQPDAELISALLNTLNSDPNVNVRLAALDAFFLFANDPRVRKELVISLARQTSPLVQIALIDFLVEKKERKAIESLRKLVNEKKLNPAVKERAQWGIKQLI